MSGGGGEREAAIQLYAIERMAHEEDDDDDSSGVVCGGVYAFVQWNSGGGAAWLARGVV